MNLGQIFAGLKSLIQDLAGQGESLADAPRDVVVDGADQAAHFPPTSSMAKVKVRLTRIQTIGRDELRQTYDTPDDEIKNTVHGNRLLTVDISAECDDESDDGTALPYLDNVQSRLRMPTAIARLQTLGLSLSTRDDIVLDTFAFDDHAISKASMTIAFNAAVSYEDLPVAYIERVNAERVP